MSRWLWEDLEVQEDLLILQKQYKALGYDLTLEQCYDAWHMYSNDSFANWLCIDYNFRNSERCVKEVLNRPNISPDTHVYCTHCMYFKVDCEIGIECLECDCRGCECRNGEDSEPYRIRYKYKERINE